MAFKRGFKSQCERRSVEVRKDLGLTNVCPLNAFNLAKHINVTVWSTRDVNGMTELDFINLEKEDDDCWSALTLRIDTNHLIIYKAGQSKPRVNSVVMHELSHIMLGHELAEACVMEDGSLAPRNFSQDQEDEADWLGGSLLLPRPALLKIRRDGLSKDETSEIYNVSKQMFDWRVRMTGVDYQMKHSRAKRTVV